MVLDLMERIGMPELIRRHYDRREQIDPVTLGRLKELFLYCEKRAREVGGDPARRPGAGRDALGRRQKLVRYCKSLGYLLHYTDRPASERAYRLALALQQTLVDDFPSDPDFRYLLATIHHQLGLLLHETGGFPDAERSFRRALALEEELVARHPEVLPFRAALGGTQLHLGRLLSRVLGRFEEAEGHYNQALDVFARLVAGRPGVPNYLQGLRNTLRDLTDLAGRPGRAAAGEEAHRRCLALLEQLTSGLAPAGGKKPPAGAVDYLAWVLATSPRLSPRDAPRVLECARQAVRHEPGLRLYPNTVGVAHYRAGQWQAAVEALRRSLGQKGREDCRDGFFLAMAYWRLGDEPSARRWYDTAVRWRVKEDPQHVELCRFQAEAAALLGLPAPAVPGG
jgi:tetratricopeptide (TPR) repeat protein